MVRGSEATQHLFILSSCGPRGRPRPFLALPRPFLPLPPLTRPSSHPCRLRPAPSMLISGFLLPGRTDGVCLLLLSCPISFLAALASSPSTFAHSLLSVYTHTHGHYKHLVKKLASWVKLCFHISINMAQRRSYTSSGDHRALPHTVPSAALCVSVKSLIATRLLQK